MQFQTLILSLLVSVVVAAPAPAPQGGICFDSFDCGLGQTCSNLQCVTAAPGSPEAVIAGSLSSLVASSLPTGISLRDAVNRKL